MKKYIMGSPFLEGVILASAFIVCIVIVGFGVNYFLGG